MENDSGERALLIERVSFGIGAAALVGGGICYAFGNSAGPARAERVVALSPLLVDGAAGGAIAGRF